MLWLCQAVPDGNQQPLTDARRDLCPASAFQGLTLITLHRSAATRMLGGRTVEGMPFSGPACHWRRAAFLVGSHLYPACQGGADTGGLGGKIQVYHCIYTTRETVGPTVRLPLFLYFEWYMVYWRQPPPLSFCLP